MLILEPTVKQNGSSSHTFFLYPTHEYEVNESLKAVFTNLRHLDGKEMETEASQYQQIFFSSRPHEYIDLPALL